jgi:hypothetical protein
MKIITRNDALALISAQDLGTDTATALGSDSQDARDARARASLQLSMLYGNELESGEQAPQGIPILDADGNTAQIRAIAGGGGDVFGYDAS